MSQEDLHALILSGGGADGAYQIGVGRALVNGRSRSTFGLPLEPEVFAGTSIGAFNAAFLVSQWDDYGGAAIANLQNVWQERIAKLPGMFGGAFRIRANPLEYFDPRYYRQPLVPLVNFLDDLSALAAETASRAFNLITNRRVPFFQRLLSTPNLSSLVVANPWEQTIQDVIDFAEIRTASKKLRIAATDWAFGEVREFTNEDMTSKLGPAAIRASTSIPGFYPPAQVGAQTYVDGAVLMNTPLSPAIKALVECLDRRVEAGEPEDMFELVLHVVYTNTEVERMPIEELESTLEVLYRQQVISWAATVNQDIARAEALNSGLAFIRQTPEEIAAETGMTGADLQAVIQAADRLVSEVKRGRRYKMVTIHRYYPPDGLDGAFGFLDVHQRRVRRLIDEGFEDASSHDCRANRCVLAGRHKVLADSPGRIEAARRAAAQ